MTTRLNDAIRGRLDDLIKERVDIEALANIEEEAYHQAAPLVTKTVAKKYPPKDMLICKKYEAAYVDDCIKLQLTAGGVEQFNFKKGEGPLVVKKTTYGIIYLADDDTTNAVLGWREAVANHLTVKKALQNDYRALIHGARTIEEVIEIWPEAAELLQYTRSQALTVLSQDVIARIRADVDRRNSLT